MKTTKTFSIVFFSALIIISISPAFAQTPKSQKALTVEGEWEVVSVSTQAWRDSIGKRLAITSRDGAYEVKWLDRTEVIIYSGNETRLVHTFLEDLGDPAQATGAGEAIPVSVLQQVAGQKVPINVSYTLSADGLFLQRAEDAKFLSWNWQAIGNQLKYIYTHHEIKAGFYTTTFKRVK